MYARRSGLHIDIGLPFKLLVSKLAMHPKFVFARNYNFMPKLHVKVIRLLDRV